MKFSIILAALLLFNVNAFAKPSPKRMTESQAERFNEDFRNRPLVPPGRYGVVICAPYSIPSYESGGPFAGNCPPKVRRR